jgi:hypothetical protein
MGYFMDAGRQVPTFQNNISATLEMDAYLARTLVPTYQTISGYDSQDHNVNSDSSTTELPAFF